jgi:hypothetical protein
MLLLYPGELYRLLGASSCNSSQYILSTYNSQHDNNNNVVLAMTMPYNGQAHFVIELLPFDYLSNQKQCQQKNAFQEE